MAAFVTTSSHPTEPPRTVGTAGVPLQTSGVATGPAAATADSAESVALSVGLAGALLRWILVGMTALGAVVGLLAWSLRTSVTVVGEGRIVPGERCRVKSALSGIIRELPVIQGQRVRAGQLLVRLDDGRWRSELVKVVQDLEMNHWAMVQTRADMRTQRLARQASRDRCRAEVEEARLRMMRLRAEAEVEDRSGLLRHWHRLPFTQRLPVRAQQAELHSREAALAVAQQQLEAVGARAAELRSLSRAGAKLRQDSILIATRLTQTRILAATSGTVLTDRLKRRIGDRVESGEVLLELAPLDSWQAEVRVSARDISRVVSGQRARLFVDAFPHLQYGTLPGTVQCVSLTPSTSRDSYRTRIRVDEPWVVDQGREYSLRYGMKAEARIVVDEGRILQLVWRHLLRSVGKVVRREWGIPVADRSQSPARGQELPRRPAASPEEDPAEKTVGVGTVVDAGEPEATI